MTNPIFIHIPKTAGSTLRTLISENYEAQHLLSLFGDPKEILIAASSHIGTIHQYHFIQGHIPYGTHRFLNIVNPRYFTFLRDPIARFFSDIAHVMRDDTSIFHHQFSEPGLSISEISSKALDIRYYRNTMVHFMSGAFTTEDISMSQLGVAIDNLWNSEFVGLTEKFEVSMLIMAKKLGWRYVVPQKCNVRPDPNEAVAPELRTRIDRALAYDRMLYAVAKEHLAKNIKKYGQLLEDAAFQLNEIIKIQSTEYPDAKFIAKWGVTEVPLRNYHARIEEGTPLYRWLNE